MNARPLLAAALLIATCPTAVRASEIVAVNARTSAPLTLGWDVQHQRPASEPTTVRVSSDGRTLTVRFHAVQREPIHALQHTDDVGQDTDDEVWVDLWPRGEEGYRYSFISTPNGTHYQSSSENSAYAPSWYSEGTRTKHGYRVTMRIPLSALRGAGKGVWEAQFVRVIQATSEEQVWTHGAAQTNPDDFTYAGKLDMDVAVAARPQPRLATYLLGTAAAPSIGGSTTRTGADLSLPITPTASLYATFHPDFSNVELDQQSISPSVYARYYSEVRPFFTQGSSFYGRFDCDACPSITELYTPAIPTPRDGYAVEGVQGPISFGAFDAVGEQRNDQATSVSYKSPDTRWVVSDQRVAVDLPGLHDDVNTAGVAYGDHKHTSFYFNYGSDSGTNVLRGDQAQRYDGGGGWYSSDFSIWGSVRKIGTYYNPADGFIQLPGAAGYGLFSKKIWTFAPRSPIADVELSAIVDRYHGSDGAYNQTDNWIGLDLLTRKRVDLFLTTGASYLRINGIMTPVNQQGAQITFNSGTQTNNTGCIDCHGNAANETTISYNTGRYGLGRLDSWTRSTTLKVGPRGALSFDLDSTSQWLPGSANVQWFERVGYTLQLGSNMSFALGVRKVVGTPPDPNGGGSCIGSCTNLALSFHARLAHSELYVAYGNPNTLSTLPQALVKWIFYAGADKGT